MIIPKIATWTGLSVRVLVALVFALTAGLSCDSVSNPEFVVGIQVSDNEPPTLTILRPNGDVSISRGGSLVIEWIDTDRDSNATIAFSLVDVNDSNNIIPLVDNIKENGDGPNDRFTVGTQLVPVGTYTLRGNISDGVNRPVTALAANRAAGLGEATIRVVEPGGTSVSNRPPQVFVRDPGFNLSVSQDDTVTIVVQPTFRDPNPDALIGPIIEDPFDADSNTLLYVVLDLDDDPLNDDVVAPDPTKIILLAGPEEIVQGDSSRREFPITIDLDQIPLRTDGSPYRIRATITDNQNTPAHSYAPGTLNVVRAASTGIIDLSTVGKTTSGALFVGFNPGSNLGTRMANLRDFDLDGVDDFCLVARFGNPRNFGNIGEAYVIYGLPGQRFGGTINVNSTAKAIQGFIVAAPPTRTPNRCGGTINVASPRTEGITDVTFIPDLDGDNRPELLIGSPHVDGVFTTRDDDPGDDPTTPGDTLAVTLELRHGSNESQLTVEASPDDIVTNFTYPGTQDLVIDSARPNTNFRSSDIEWVNVGPGNEKWGLLKMSNILEQFPTEDSPLTVQNATAELTLQVLEAGGQATVHELLRDFNELTDTFNTFGLPVEGVDYVEESLTTASAQTVGATVRIDVTELMQRILFGDLTEINLIFVPGDAATSPDAGDAARLASKEFGDNRQRPTLTITYDRDLGGGPLGCYPDILPNNYADQFDDDTGCNERKFEALGFVSILSSTNRDANARRDPNRLSEVIPDRLTNTIVSLDLIGMRPAITLGFNIDAREEAVGAEPDRIAGARFQAGFYDFFDDKQLAQPPLEGLFGMSVAWIPDVDLDGNPEVVISSPTNERDIRISSAIPNSTHVAARRHRGSITVIPGENYDQDVFRDKPGAETGTTTIPWMDDLNIDTACGDPGACSSPGTPRCGPRIIDGTWEIFAENDEDFLGAARSAGDFNLDTVSDLTCGAPLNDRSTSLIDTGAMYIVYGRSPVGNVRLADADDPFKRPPMLRVRGETPGDRIGWKQEPVTDINGDGIDDVMFSSPTADFIVPRPECVDPLFEGGLDSGLFNACTEQREVFLGDVCKNFDFDNDRVVDEDDRAVLTCLQSGGTDCCPVDNGYIGIIFGGIDRQGDRVISQLGTNELSGVVFYGTRAGDRAGYDIGTAGDFDKDGFGDILITAPGEVREDGNGRLRMGVTYLIFGGPHLENQEVPIELSEIGDRIPGLIFLSPFVAGAPDEAPTENIGYLGDINGDGFSDIGIGVPKADLLDEEFPQGDGSLNDTGRRPDQGNIYIIYGNNVGR